METTNFWDTFLPQPILYIGRCEFNSKQQVATDVKTYIMPNDLIVQAVVKKHGFSIVDNDTAVYNIQRWLMGFITYVTDQREDGVPEFWNFPFETLQRPLGDCDEGAILMATMMIASGVPSERVRVVAGNVRENANSPWEGHCYCAYKASDDQWRIIDWCFLADPQLRPLQKPLAKDGGTNGCYGEAWFVFNDQGSWAPAPTTMASRATSMIFEQQTSSLLTQLLTKM